MSDKLIVIAYGIFLLIGAFFGWKKGSTISLITGLISGILVLLGAYWTGLSPKNGYLFLSMIGVVLTVVFIMRVLKTHQFMPAGLLLLITFLFLLFCLTRFSKA